MSIEIITKTVKTIHLSHKTANRTNQRFKFIVKTMYKIREQFHSLNKLSQKLDFPYLTSAKNRNLNINISVLDSFVCVKREKKSTH